MLPQRRHGIHASVPSRSTRPGGSKAGIGPAGVSTCAPAIPRLELRMLPQAAHVVHARVGDAGRVEPGDHLLGDVSRESLDDPRAQAHRDWRCAQRCERSARRRRAAAGPAPCRRTSPTPARSAGRASRSCRRRRETGRTGRSSRGCAGARRRRRAVEGVVERIAHPLGHAPPASRRRSRRPCRSSALDERGQDARVGVHAGCDVGDREAGLARLFRRAGHGQKARLRSGSAGRRPCVAVRAVLAVAGDVADDQPRVLVLQRLVREPEPGGRARREVLDETSALPTSCEGSPSAAACLTSSVRLSLDRLVQTKCDARPLTALVVVAREIADAGPLDLDHARAEIGELARRERRRDRVLKRER